MDEKAPSTNKLGSPTNKFSISTEINKSRLLSFPRFLMDTSEGGRFGNIVASNFRQIAGEGTKSLLFDAIFYKEQYQATVRMKLESPLDVEVFSRQGENARFLRRLEDYLLLSLQFFEELVRSETVYITFVPGSEPTSKVRIRRPIFERLFSGNMLALILVFFVIAAIIFTTLYSLLGAFLTPIVLLAILLSIMLSAGKIMAVRSDWRITEEHPEIAIVEMHLDSGMSAGFMAQYGPILPALKREIYNLVAMRGRSSRTDDIVHLFNKFGIRVSPEQIVFKVINIHELVSRSAERFNMPTPTIVVTRNLKPNAAATGFSKHLATMLITIGLLIQLDKRETELVVGHELSHLRSRDPAILFSIISVEYLLRVFVLYPYIWRFSLLYLILFFWLLFFFGKFLESRADLEAALILKDPKTMATSLKKIGFKRLTLDTRFIEGGISSFGNWMAFDAHPPIGFRIRRLESLDISQVPKHTFLRSVADVFRGMFRSMRGQQ